MSGKVPLGIFWDIENCPIPQTKSASKVAKSLREFLAMKHPECKYAQEFVCVADISKLNTKTNISEGLHRNGVDVLHVNNSAKNAADDKLEEQIDKFVDICNGSGVLCVITGDTNFAKPIRKARRKDINVILIHGYNCSEDLKNLVTEYYSFDDIIKNVDSFHINDSQIKSCYLQVSNLPRDKEVEAIDKRLSKLSLNCGGKPEVISNEKVFIRFLCRDDAQRCLQRINGTDVFGHKIEVKLFEENIKDCETYTLKSSPKRSRNRSRNRNISKSLDRSKSIALETQILDIQQTYECQSIIIGLNFIPEQNLTQSLKQLLIKYNVKELNPEFITNVVFKGEMNEKHLIVTATSPQTNNALVSSAQKYLIRGNSIKWILMSQYMSEISKPFYGRNKSMTRLTNNSVENTFSDDRCKSVIKGLDTKCKQNVTKLVRKIVQNWNETTVNPNFIKNVERDRKYEESDGFALLFVTAISPEKNRELVTTANKYLDQNNGIEWSFYQRKNKYIRKNIINKIVINC